MQLLSLRFSPWRWLMRMRNTCYPHHQGILVASSGAQEQHRNSGPKAKEAQCEKWGTEPPGPPSLAKYGTKSTQQQDCSASSR
ncbi:hypothetical protein CRENBAI_000511 [Crenichthys baileyi]|uniref:Uncharacterized protein n=1 Tax=Crenichthys baileyi TaxID=28760 RepID=A0AAV9S5T5_9TELE